MKTSFAAATVGLSLIVFGGLRDVMSATPEAVLRVAREAASGIQSDELAIEFHVQAAAAAAQAELAADTRQGLTAAWDLLDRVEGEDRRSLLFGLLDVHGRGGDISEALARVKRLKAADRAASLVLLASDTTTWPPNATDALLASLHEEQPSARIREAIARVYVDKGRIDEAVQMVEASLGGDAGETERADTMFLELVARAAQQRNYDAARKLAEHINNLADRDAAECQLASAAVDNGDTDEGWKTLRSVRPSRLRDLASLRLIESLAGSGRFQSTQELVDELHEDVRGLAHALIAVAYARRGRVRQTTGALREALSRIADDEQKDDSRRKVAVALAEIGCIQEAERILDDVDNPEGRSAIHEAIAARLHRLGCKSRARTAYEMAVSSLDPLPVSIARAALLRKLAANAIAHGDHALGRDILLHACGEVGQAGLNGGGEVTELCEIGTLLARNFGLASAQPVFDTAIRSAELYPDAAYVARLLQEIGRSRAKAGDAEGAVDWGTREQNALLRAFILVGVAHGLGKLPIEREHPADILRHCQPRAQPRGGRLCRLHPRDRCNGRATARR